MHAKRMNAVQSARVFDNIEKD